MLPSAVTKLPSAEAMLPRAEAMLPHAEAKPLQIRKKDSRYRSLFRGAWRSRTALAGFADRRLNRSSNTPFLDFLFPVDSLICDLAGAKVRK